MILNKLINYSKKIPAQYSKITTARELTTTIYKIYEAVFLKKEIPSAKFLSISVSMKSIGPAFVNERI